MLKMLKIKDIINRFFDKSQRYSMPFFDESQRYVCSCILSQKTIVPKLPERPKGVITSLTSP